MTQIRQAVFGLLGLSIVLLLLVAGTVALYKITAHPLLNVTPPEMKSFSNVNMVREAKNLEGLRKVCEVWADYEDRSRAYQTALHSRMSGLMEDAVVAIGFLATLYAVGLLYIYLKLLRVQRQAPGAAIAL